MFRTPKEERETGLMLRPVSADKAYAALGLAIGTFPPAAIFTKIFWNARIEEETLVILILLFAVNLVCAFAGYGMGRVLGKTVVELERKSWSMMFLLVPFLAMAWGITTGAIGGLVFFGFGAFFGPFFAVPVSLVAFTVFAVLHRLIETGGMIERKHLLPIAFGISLTISAFILGL